MTGVSQAAHSLPTGFDTLASDNPINSQSRGMIPTGFKQEIRVPTATIYRVSSADTRCKIRTYIAFVSFLQHACPKGCEFEWNAFQSRAISPFSERVLPSSISAGYERSLSKKEYSKNQANFLRKFLFARFFLPPPILPLPFFPFSSSFFSTTFYSSRLIAQKDRFSENLVSKMETRAYISSERTYNSVT